MFVPLNEWIQIKFVCDVEIKIYSHVSVVDFYETYFFVLFFVLPMIFNMLVPLIAFYFSVTFKQLTVRHIMLARHLKISIKFYLTII